MASGLVFDALRASSGNYITANLLLPTHITCLVYVGKHHLIWNFRANTDSGDGRHGLLRLPRA